MEIRDFVRANRRPLRLLVVLPVVAGALALLVLWGEPQQHRANVEVVIVPEGNESLNPNAIGQYVANFGKAVHSKEVKDAVVAATGVERASLNDVETRQIGRSNVIEVSYVGLRRALAKEVVVASARETILVVAEPELDALAAARELHDATEAKRDAAVAALDAFTAETGLLLPEQEYQSRAGQLRIMQDNRERSLASGGRNSVAALDEVIADRQAELEELGLQVQRFQELERQLAVSTDELRMAASGLRSAEATVERTSLSLDLPEAEARALPRSERLLAGVAVAAGLTLVVGVALMVLLEMFRNRGSAPSTAAAAPDRTPLALAPASPVSELQPAVETAPTASGETVSGSGATRAIPGAELPGRDSEIGRHLTEAFAALTRAEADAPAPRPPADTAASRAEGRR